MSGPLLADGDVAPARPATAAKATADVLTVSVVVYHPDMPQLAETLDALAVAAREAIGAGAVAHVRCDLIDNGSPDPAPLDALLAGVARAAPGISTRLVGGHGNVGYGRGHNLSIATSGDSTYHLVLNPDLVMAPDALIEAVRFLDAHPEVGLLSPRVENASGEVQYLARRTPSVFALFLRGFAPAALRRRCASYLDRYEMRDRLGAGDREVRGIPCATGCFMFARGPLLRAVGGFSDAYFLYFEDYDLSLALGRRAVNAFVPRVRVCHYGGNASRKGWRHVGMFVRSAVTFFNRHGWRIA